MRWQELPPAQRHENGNGNIVRYFEALKDDKWR
jgi:hypothetical protein